MRILLLIISLAVVTACTSPNKKNTTTTEEVKPSDLTTPEGVIIQPQTETDTLKGSPKAYAVGKIGGANFTINYYSPATRGRMIWGGLVAYDNVWVTGAHKATSIEFDHDIKVGETIVTAGKYAFFTIPGKDQWTVIFNKNWNQHLADDYSEAEDVVRLNVVPETEEQQQERLRYVIKDEGAGAGEIVMYWEKLEVSIPVTIAN
ncbi:MAG: DUF2911 domain-containing protein [Cyclobacteriaceae bacterium]|jgi:hypothetical protein|nr:DUF2911 domain-containing protein [Cyclobacteriaceae bacterium]